MYRTLPLLSLPCLILLGCSSTKHPVVPVEGKITYANGTHLPVGTKLTFRPTEGGVGCAMATTDASGNFTVTHHKGKAGAETGKYLVSLSGPDGDKVFYKKVPSKYIDEGIFVEVREGIPPLNLVIH